MKEYRYNRMKFCTYKPIRFVEVISKLKATYSVEIISRIVEHGIYNQVIKNEIWITLKGGKYKIIVGEVDGELSDDNIEELIDNNLEDWIEVYEEMVER